MHYLSENMTCDPISHEFNINEIQPYDLCDWSLWWKPKISSRCWGHNVWQALCKDLEIWSFLMSEYADQGSKQTSKQTVPVQNAECWDLGVHAGVREACRTPGRERAQRSGWMGRRSRVGKNRDARANIVLFLRKPTVCTDEGTVLMCMLGRGKLQGIHLESYDVARHERSWMPC